MENSKQHLKWYLGTAVQLLKSAETFDVLSLKAVAANVKNPLMQKTNQWYF